MTATTEGAERPQKRLRSGGQMKEQISANDNSNVLSFGGIFSPSVLCSTVPISEKAEDVILRSREAQDAIIKGDSDRLIIIIGPCSIHCFKSALDYAERLMAMRVKYGDELEIIMRVYFEKPRTTVGWKGFINDPDLNGSNNVNKGLILARTLLLDIANLGLPTATEFLETFTPQYIGDLISYAAIGARTTPCPLHQRLASGLSMPVGIKNLTDGQVVPAVDAIAVAQKENSFLGLSTFGVPAYFNSTGNPSAHIILRGGSNGTNYSSESISFAGDAMEKQGLPGAVVVDSSHANSQKKHKNQLLVIDDLCKTMETDTGRFVKGMMIESHIHEGNQSLEKMIADNQAEIAKRKADTSATHLQKLTVQDDLILNKLKSGVSITDACINWEDTEVVLAQLAAAVRARRK